ncbi:MAG: uL15m family ribosomal protein [Candidatus Micrarchaeota archaeon]
MPRRKQKRKIRMRGSRFHGFGNVKNKRGKGCRGGVGRAGLHKHKFSWTARHNPDYGRLMGFVPHAPGRRLPATNLFEINTLAEKGGLQQKEGKLQFEFRGKILGAGELRHPIALKALSWSKIAERKVKEAGGELSRIE